MPKMRGDYRRKFNTPCAIISGLQVARALTDLRSLARSHTEMGVRTLAAIATRSDSDAARVRAIELLFDRGWGKAPQLIGADGEGLAITIRHIVESTAQAVDQPAPSALPNGKEGT